MKKLSRKILFTSSVVALVPVMTTAQRAGNRPNLILIMADQLRGTALGCMGTEPVQTPNIDRMAEEGVMLSDAVSSYPVSSPARGMMMSGMYPNKNRVRGNCQSATAPFGCELPADMRCWSDVLHDEGYATAYIGKWHLDSPYEPYIDCYNNKGAVKWNEWCPPERRHGFDTWISYGTYDRHLRPIYWNTTGGRQDFYYVDEWGPQYEADRAIEYLHQVGDKARSGSPFAMVVSMNPPHTVVDQVPKKYRNLYRNLNVDSICATRPDLPPANTPSGKLFRKTLRDYYACITGIDEQIGRIMRTIADLGLDENTLVVFTSDHGACMGLHNIDGKNIYYEEAMRVPMIFRWKGSLEPRRDSRIMMANNDLYRTMLSLMGLGDKIPAEIETKDFSAEIKGTKKPDKNQEQPYFFIKVTEPGTGFRGLRTSTHTFAVCATKGRIDSLVLFDRRSDAYDMHNKAAKKPKLVRKLTERLRAFLKRTDDPFLSCLSEKH